MTEQDFNQQVENQTEQIPSITLQDLPEKMLASATRMGWTTLTPVQAGGIPYFLLKRDMMAQARTGSGKTGAYLLPIIEAIDPRKDFCQALVLVPTRELAQQVTAEARALSGENGVRVVAVYGGTSYQPQIDAFKKGAHLVVATPGRVLDHLLKRNLHLDRLDYLVFDEADRMLSMGFFPDMVRVQDFLPNRDIHSSMFSATFPMQVMRLTNRFLNDPVFLSFSRDHVHVLDTEHVFYLVPGMDKDRALVRIIEMENPSQAIIFCNTKDKVFYVTRVLQRFGYNADQLSSDLPQKARDQVLDNVREGKLRFLVATDVAARGIDIPELSHVFQYEPPEDLELYIHRAGRTGRSGVSGTAVLLVTYNEKKYVTRFGAHYNIKFEERPMPKDEDVQALVAQRLVGQLEGRLRERDRLQVERMQRFLPLVKELAEEEDGVALLAMLLDDTYHDWMHHFQIADIVTATQAPIKTRERPTAKKNFRSKRRG
ncbi:MAG: ATP-dependent helicase [Chloroflexi bacterium HGW-Chloroflexi-10]|nr:MAG: ATP-dependent helicase [Chloroflexi bacterium HGW-Chloroflexi-10]